MNKSEKTDFLNHFYKHCMHGKIKFASTISNDCGSIQRKSNSSNHNFCPVFIAPLLSNTGAGSPEKTDSCTVQVDLGPHPDDEDQSI